MLQTANRRRPSVQPAFAYRLTAYIADAVRTSIEFGDRSLYLIQALPEAVVCRHRAEAIDCHGRPVTDAFAEADTALVGMGPSEHGALLDEFISLGF